MQQSLLTYHSAQFRMSKEEELDGTKTPQSPLEQIQGTQFSPSTSQSTNNSGKSSHGENKCPFEPCKKAYKHSKTLSNHLNTCKFKPNNSKNSVAMNGGDDPKKQLFPAHDDVSRPSFLLNKSGTVSECTAEFFALSNKNYEQNLAEVRFLFLLMFE